VQVQIITVSEKFDDYGRQIEQDLRASYVRARLDASNDSMGKKIRNASKLKIPNVIVVGEQEQTDKTVTWRRYVAQDNQQTLPLDEFKAAIAEKIAVRSLETV